MKSFIFVALFIFTNVNAADKLNPDLSINFLGLYRYSALGNDSSYSQPNGFFMQEAEILSSANIDAYFRGNVAFALRKESTGYKIEP